MQRLAKFVILLLVALCIAADGDSNHRHHSGGSSASGSATASTGDGAGFTSIVVSTSTSTTDADGTTTRTHRSSSTGGDSKREQTVDVEDGSVTSTSRARGSGSVSASASSSSTPSRSRGSASTTVDGETQTVTKEKERGQEAKTTKSTSRRETPTASVTRSSPRESTVSQIPLCRGLAKYDCCDDKTFVRIDGTVYCGCWGLRPDKSFCSFQRVNRVPVVVKDIFFDDGEECRCPSNNARETNNNAREEVRVVENGGLDEIDIDEEEIHECIGLTREACCNNPDGNAHCRCDDDDNCQFERILNKPLMWRHVKYTSRICKC